MERICFFCLSFCSETIKGRKMIEFYRHDEHTPVCSCGCGLRSSRKCFGKIPQSKRKSGIQFERIIYNLNSNNILKFLRINNFKFFIFICTKSSWMKILFWATCFLRTFLTSGIIRFFNISI